MIQYTKRNFTDWCETLDDGDVSIVVAELGEIGPDLLESFERLLSPEERDRRQRLAFRESRNEFVVGRGILRTRLGALLKCPPECVSLSIGEAGKPILVPPSTGSGFWFNLSHSAGLVAVGVSASTDLGLDVMSTVRRISRFQEIAQQFFTPREFSWITSTDHESQWYRFVRVFVQKEAIVKRMSLGLGVPLNSFEVDLETGTRCTSKGLIYELPEFLGGVLAVSTVHDVRHFTITQLQFDAVSRFAMSAPYSESLGGQIV